ncbi:MAG: DUF4286 family protein [Duncaniella sp.]|nr:DUF4286 family protein [Duncaniella sp.]MDE6391274.1 DUF4286 family protein [Duncaniella sp.]
MTILNTTFYVDAMLEREFLAWLKESYMPASPLSGGSVARIMAEVEPGFSSFAVRFEAGDLGEAMAWNDGEGAILRGALCDRLGVQRVLHFSTFMEEIPL